LEKKDEIIQIMMAADLDNSGTINYTEFLAATLEQSIFMKEENLRNAFKLFDINQDGKIEVDELKQIIGGNKNTVSISEE
jgi:calcium-dependent protein kinase